MPIGDLPLGSGIIAGGIEGSVLAGTHPFRSLLYKLALRVDPKTKRQQLVTGGESYYTITATTDASPIEVTIADSHSLQTGDQVFITGCVGGEAVVGIDNTLANRYYTITKVSSSKFTLDGTSAPGVAGSAGTVYPALIGSVDGEVFTAERLLAIYNEARYALFLAIKSALGREAAMNELGDMVTRKADLAFSGGEADKPADFIWPVLLTDSAKKAVSVLPYDSYERIRNAESADARVVFDAGTKFISENAGLLPDDDNYILRYIAISDFTMTDVFDDSVPETFNPRWHPLLLDIAQMICNEQGALSVVSWAAQFIRKG